MATLATIRAQVRDDLKDLRDCQVEACESGWVAASNVTVTHDDVVFKEGAKSMKAVIADAFTTGVAAYKDLSEVDLTEYEKITIWVRASIATFIAGDLEICLCQATGGAGIVDNIDIPAIATANQWYRFTISLTDPTLLVNIVGVALNVVTDRGACDVYVDDIRAEKSSRWADAELNRYIEHAVHDVSQAKPLEQKNTLQTVANSYDIDISSLTLRVEVYGIEYKVDQSPKLFRNFKVWGDVLTLDLKSAPGAVADAYVYWGKMYTVDAASSNVPDELLNILIDGASAYACMAWANYAINRVNIGGPAVDNAYLRFAHSKLAKYLSELRAVKRLHAYKTHPRD